MNKKSWIRAGAALLLAMACPAAAMAQTAVVDNGSDPQSKLNMRAEPSRDAKAIGQFYSGTTVEIIADAGSGWSQVSIGQGKYALEGYMMSSYLKSGSAAESVLNATFEMKVVSPYGTQSVVLRDAPSNSYDAVAVLTVGEAVQVIGVSGEFYYVVMEDDCVGCLANDELK